MFNDLNVNMFVLNFSVINIKGNVTMKNMKNNINYPSQKLG